ncbi:unnamed protein product, partial [Discosporangium mesarthrocarpum]
VKVRELNPSRGGMTGGTSVTLFGQGFENSSQTLCQFGRTTQVQAIFRSTTEVTCIAPSSTVDGAVTVEVTVNGVDFSTSGPMFTYIEDPTILNIRPNNGPTSGGTTVFVHGTNFVDSDELRCRFGAILQPARWMAKDLIQCISPAGPRNGTTVYELEVTTNGLDFTQNRIEFTFHDIQVLGLSPSIGSLEGGTTVSIFGSGFIFSAEMALQFGRVQTPVTFVSSSELRCISPPSSSAGSTTVLVSNNGMDFEEGTGEVFHYMRPPSIEKLEPSWGVVGDASFAVRGHNFVNTTDLGCKYGTWNVLEATFVSDSHVICEVPAEYEEVTFSVEVTFNGVDFTTAGLFFTVLEAPQVFFSTPDNGPVGGGTSVHVTGANFSDSGGFECIFDSRSVPGQRQSTTDMYCTSPGGEAAGTVSFAVTFHGRTIFAEDAGFIYYNEPAVKGVKPCWGVVEGGTSISILGEYFLPSRELSAKFGQTVVTATFISSYEMQCLAPAHLPGNVTVTASVNSVDFGQDGANFVYTALPPPTWLLQGDGCAGGEAVLQKGTQLEEDRGIYTEPRGKSFFDMDSEPYIVALNPSSGSSSGGTIVLVSGNNFVDSGDLECVFGRSVVPGLWLSSDIVQCQAPASHENTTVPVLVTSSAPNFTASGATFTYRVRPTVHRVHPSLGPRWGRTIVSVYGEGFTYSNVTMSHFGRIAVPAIFISPSELRCVSPPQLSGVVSLTIGDKDEDFTSDANITFEYIEPVTIKSLHPRLGGSMGGVDIYLYGDGFVNSSSLACMFSGVGVVLAQYLSDTEIVCTSPSSLINGPVIVEVTVNGVDFTADGSLFTFSDTSLVLSASPRSGPSTGGTVVLVTGINFVSSHDVECSFGSVVSLGQWLTPGLIKCVSPAGQPSSSVPLIITPKGGSPSYGQPFSYYSSPIISDVYPTVGSTIGGEVLSISGSNFFFSSTMLVRFGYSDVPVTYIGPSLLQCTAPAGPSGMVFLSFSMNGVDFGRTNITYTYLTYPKGYADGRGSEQFNGQEANVNDTNFNATGLRCFTYSPSEAQRECVEPTDAFQGITSLGLNGTGTDPTFSDVNSPQSRNPFVTSISPASGPVSGGTNVIVQGMDFPQSSSLYCHFGLARVAAQLLSPTSVQCQSPPGSENLMVNVRVTSEVVGPSLSTITFTYIQATVTGVTPTFGTSKGGTTVIIHGTGFTFNSQLHAQFGATDVPVTFVNSSALHCTTVASLGGEVEVVVSIDGEKLQPRGNPTFVFIEGPRVDSLLPPQGSIAGGTVTIVKGRNFVNTTSLACIFNGDSAVPAVYMSADEVICVTPISTTTGFVPVEIGMNGVQVTDDGAMFMYYEDPFILSISPALGPVVGGTLVHIFGGHFADSGEIRCQFGELLVPGVWVSSRHVGCVSPSLGKGVSRTHHVALGLAVNGRDFISSVTGFSYVPLLGSLISMSPESASVAGGVVAYFKGNALPFSSEIRAQFGQAEVHVTYLNSSTLACIIPASHPGAVEVSLHTRGIPILGDNRLIFSYLGNAEIDALVPSHGSIMGGANIFVQGRGFENTTNLGCRFAETIMVKSQFISGSEVVCLTPRYAHTGPVPVEVTLNGVDFTDVGSVRFNYTEEVPGLDVAPTGGPMTGGTLVTVSGIPLEEPDVLACRFGSNVVPARWISAGVVQCESPLWDGNNLKAQLDIVFQGSKEVSEGSFFWYQVVELEKLIPTQGNELGGTSVAVLGSGFDTDLRWYCWFGSQVVPAHAINRSELQCISPAKSGDSDSARVKISSGKNHPAIEAPGAFQYVPAIEMITVWPAGGATNGGTSVTLGIRHNLGLTEIPLHCEFGGVGWAAATWINESAVECIAPPHVPGGTVLLRVSAEGPVVTSTIPASSLPFHYYEAPVVLQLYPTWGRIATEGSKPMTVTVTGANFEGSSHVSCRFGEWVFAARWVSPSVIKCTLIDLPVGEYEVAVSNNMLDFVQSGLIFHQLPALHGSRVKASGAWASAAVTGAACADCAPENGLWCFFEELSAPAMRVSDVQLICVAPPHQSGDVVFQMGYSLQHRFSTKMSITYIDERINVRATIIPPFGPMVGGTAVTIGGINALWFNDTVHCQFGQAPPSPAQISSTDIVCISPPSASQGKVSLSLLDSAREFEVGNFDYFSPLKVEHVHPYVVDVAGNINITFFVDQGSWQHVVANYSDLSCKFSDKLVPAILDINSLTVRCTAPSAASGPAVVTIWDRTCQFSVGEFNLIYHPTPVVSRISPSTGFSSGGSLITVYGHFFLSGEDLSCSFGKYGAVKAAWLSPTKLQCLSPSMDVPGDVHIAVSNNDEIVPHGVGSPLLLPSSPPRTASIWPSTGPTHGGTIIHLQGSEIPDTEGLECRFQGNMGAQLTNATWVSSYEIVCTTPPWGQAEEQVIIDLVIDGVVVVERMGGMLQYAFRHPMAVVSLYPDSAPGVEHVRIQVVGSNFPNSPALACAFCSNGSLDCVSTSGRWASSTEIWCDVPKQSPGTVTVEVTHNGVDYTRSGAQYRFLPKSHVTQMSPVSGSTQGGTKVSIYGTSFPFTGDLSCRFGDSHSPAIYISENHIVCISPQSPSPANVSVGICVNGIDLTSSDYIFEYVLNRSLAVTLTVNPTYGDARGGTPVVVEGFREGHVASLRRNDWMCNFGNTSAPLRHISNTSGLCITPPHSDQGTIDLEIFQINGRSSESRAQFMVLPAIEFKSANPAMGTENGGESVLVSGNGFTQTPRVCCRFGEVTTHANVISATAALCTTPPSPVGSAHVLLEISHNCLDFYGLGLGFHYVSEKLVTQPSSKSGTPILLSGFEADGIVEACLFTDGYDLVMEEPVFSVARTGKRGCTSPPWPSPGITSLQLRVTGSPLLTAASSFLFYAHPRLESIRPQVGSVYGGTVLRLNGAGFPNFPSLRCRFITADNRQFHAAAWWISNMEIWCTTPALPPGETYVEVSANGVSYTSGSDIIFDVTPVTTVHSVTPTLGYSVGGTEVTVTGSSFRYTSAIMCQFGESQAPATVVDSTKVICITTPIAGGPDASDKVNVTISVNDQDLMPAISVFGVFLYLPTPEVTRISPSSGPLAGGTAVTVSGKNFNDVGERVMCKFGDKLVYATPVSQGEVLCQSPPHVEGKVMLGVSTDGGRGFSSHGDEGPMYTYLPSLHVSSVFPSVAPVSGTTVVSVFGSGFVNSPSLACRFGKDSEPSLGKWVSTTHTKCSTNPYNTIRTPRVVEIDVSNDMKHFTDSGVRFTFNGPLTVASIFPDSGPNRGGTPVTITGNNFAPENDVLCRFGLQAVAAAVVDRGYLICSSPPTHITGRVDFSVVSSSQNSLHSKPFYFEYGALPTVSGIQPSLGHSGFPGINVTVDGSGFTNCSQLSCRWGDGPIIPAHFVSSTEVQCEVMTNSPGAAKLEVTNNAIDFSTSNVYL